MAAAAGNLNDIGTTVRAANTAAAASTTDLIAAAGDEVSLAIARAFGAYGRDYQAIGVQAAEFHGRFVETLRAGAGSLWGCRGRQCVVFAGPGARSAGPDQRAHHGSAGATADR
nr:PE family protein [Mycobacterium shottsii]